MIKGLLKRTHTLGFTPGFVPVSQGVNAILVDRCCAPQQTEEEFRALVEDAAEYGFELTKMS